MLPEYGDVSIQQFVIAIRAEARLRTTSSPLIDQDEITLRSIRCSGLMACEDGQRATGATTDIYNRIR